MKFQMQQRVALHYERRMYSEELLLRFAREQSLIEDKTLEFEDFTKRLQETIAWCAPRISINNPENCLRSPELKPPGWPPDYMFESHFADFTIQKRHELLANVSKPVIESALLQQGSLLFFTWENCLYEGAVYSETDGYIDVIESPPWDTWIICGTFEYEDRKHPLNGQGYLMSWVPVVFLNLVDSGFPVMTIDWLDWIVQTFPPLASDAKGHPAPLLVPE